MAGNLIPPDPNEPLQPALAGGNLPVPSEGLYPVAPPEEMDDGIQWGRYIAALKRYKWLMLLVVVAGTALGVVATRFIAPEYSVSATIWIEPPPERTGPIREDPLVQSYAWQQLLQTALVLETVVREDKLYLQPEDPADQPLFDSFTLGDHFLPGKFDLVIGPQGERYTLRNAKGAAIDSGQVGDSIGRSLGFEWAPAATQLGRDREIKFAVTSPRDASNDLSSRLTPQMAENGNFLQLSLIGSDPARITRTLNTLVDVFVAKAAELKRDKAAPRSRHWQLQKDSTYDALQRAGLRWKYKVRYITQPSEGHARGRRSSVTQSDRDRQLLPAEDPARAAAERRESAARACSSAPNRARWRWMPSTRSPPFRTLPTFSRRWPRSDRPRRHCSGS